MSDQTCGWVPYPGSGGYGHWKCERPQGHTGRHRFANYTISRWPKVWRVRKLWRAFKTDRRLRSMPVRAGQRKQGYGYRKTLFPSRFDPVDGS